MYACKLIPLHCTSALAACMMDFVEQKRAIGQKFNGGVEVFNLFDRFCREQGLEAPLITKELLSRWEAKRPHENESTQQFRVSYVRELCKYMHANGYSVPTAFHPEPKRSNAFVPHIFTKSELSGMFAAMESTKFVPQSPLRHLVMPILFRFIYTCGLRASEAARVRITDMDLENGCAEIYNAKGDRDRVVGISDSMLMRLRDYRRSQPIREFRSEYFFPAPDGGFYDTSTLYDFFRDSLFDAGIHHRGRGYGPRMHDLRHSFAVHVLERWSRAGKDVYTCLPILRIYLGHEGMKTTEQYLRLVPSAYDVITKPFENRFETITEKLKNEHQRHLL